MHEAVHRGAPFVGDIRGKRRGQRWNSWPGLVQRQARRARPVRLELDGFEVALEAVIAPHLHHLASGARGRDAESIALALDDERGHLSPRRARASGSSAACRRAAAARAERPGRGRRRRPSRPRCGKRRGPERATADDEWQAGELAGAQALEDGDPGGVELGSACRRPAAGNAVRLLDQGDGNALGLRRVRRCLDVRRVDSSSGPVAENETRARLGNVA